MSRMHITRRLCRLFAPRHQQYDVREHSESAAPDLDGPRDAVLAIDASGSMTSRDWKPSRMKAAREGASEFVERMAREQPDSRIAIVAYGDVGQLVIPLTPAYERAQLQAAIDSIPGQGGTDMTSGLEIALDLLMYSGRPGQVVLLTDGFHNGNCSPEPVADQLKQYAVIDCIGIAGSPGSVDERLLRYIASTNSDGSKRYRWIGDKQQLVQHFRDLAGRIARR